ncbi:hypothetical protein B2H86_02725 [Clostridium botulinum]|nr:hypothetical protein B2H86_02725 [Clostridium botulinum]
MNIDIPIIKNKSVQLTIITSIVLMCCIIMGIVDAIIKPSYAVKSAFKLLLIHYKNIIPNLPIDYTKKM